MDYDYKQFVKDKLLVLGLTSSRFKEFQMNERAAKVTDRAKRKHRSEMKLRHWGKLKYHSDPWCKNMTKNPPIGQLTVDYIDYSSTSPEDFVANYEKKNIPVIIRGGTDHWRGMKNWTFQVYFILILKFRICMRTLKIQR